MQEYKSYLKPSVFIGCGVLLVVFSILLIWKSGIFESNEVEILDSSTENSEQPSQTKLSSVTVEVVGAVKKPGVYTLPLGSRVEDALLSAGDIDTTADVLIIEKTINKAAKLTDGQKIYIPKIGDPSVTLVAGAQSALININNGSQSDLESLPGVGAVTAIKIINGRPYGSLEELTVKKIVSASVFEKIKDEITLY